MLIFLDLETTGLHNDDKICSLGMILQDDSYLTCFYNLVNEGKKISAEASSVNNITNEMIAGKPTFGESEICNILHKHNNAATTLIVHNALFVLGKMNQAGFIFQGNIIDTKRICRHKIEDLSSYALQYLRYELKLYCDEEQELKNCYIEKHNYLNTALYDAIIIKLLYQYWLGENSYAELCELSTANVMLKKFEFGKYKGKYIEEVAHSDAAYIQWLHASVADSDTDLCYTLEHYL